MVVDDPTAGEAGDQPAIVEIETANIRFAANHALNALELTVTASDGSGYRTWVGADLAPRAALLFCAAVVRLVEGITT